jgi:fumarate reductase subunit D
MSAGTDSSFASAPEARPTERSGAQGPRRAAPGRRPVEPFLWLLFSAGGVLSAMLMPALVFLFGVAFPLGWVAPPTYEHLLALVVHPLTRIALLVLCVLALFHWAHRFRYTVYDGLQIKHLDEVINGACYGGAIAGSVAAAYVFLLAV